MKTPSALLLLILLLVPRLSAAMPHALACGTAALPAAMAHHDHAATEATSATDLAADPHAGHHPHHPAGTAQDGDASADAATLAPQANANTADAGECTHCGQCDEHCSALAFVSPTPQNDRLSLHDLSVVVFAGKQAGFPHDLNRPPRTASL